MQLGIHAHWSITIKCTLGIACYLLSILEGQRSKDVAMEDKPSETLKTGGPKEKPGCEWLHCFG